MARVMHEQPLPADGLPVGDLGLTKVRKFTSQNTRNPESWKSRDSDISHELTHAKVWSVEANGNVAVPILYDMLSVHEQLAVIAKHLNQQFALEQLRRYRMFGLSQHLYR